MGSPSKYSFFAGYAALNVLGVMVAGPIFDQPTQWGRLAYGVVLGTLASIALYIFMRVMASRS
jgi:hypothetical protein